MASIAVSNVTAISFNQSKLSVSGFPIEVYRVAVAGGIAAGDTVVIPNASAPTRERGLVKGVLSGQGHNLPLTGGSNVTITFPGAVGASVPIDVVLVWQPR